MDVSNIKSELQQSQQALLSLISSANGEIESANSIELIEEYATGELKMQYPKSQQCIYVDTSKSAPDDLVDRIKEKAYKE